MAEERWMTHALQLAMKAKEQGEVPIGAVLVMGDTLLAEGFNQPITACDPTAHAEIVVLRQAALAMKNYRLPGTTLYTTLEPCAMCAGAIVHARVQRLVFAASDPKAGAAGSVCNLVQHSQLNHRVDITSDILAEPASQLLKTFFQERR